MIELCVVDYIPEWIGYSGIFLSLVMLSIIELDSIFSFVTKYIKAIMICCFCVIAFSSFVVGYNYSKHLFEEEINKLNEENAKKTKESENVSINKLSEHLEQNTKIIEKTTKIKEKVLVKESDDFRDYIDLINEAADE